MKEPTFVWDPAKERENIRKHRITFEEAKYVFRDEDGIRIFDNDHSEDEDRFILIGLGGKGRLLVVVHCFRNSDLEIRIISARKAVPNETIQYTRRKL
jgi:uncharacterized DUF497 family protein